MQFKLTQFNKSSDFDQIRKERMTQILEAASPGPTMSEDDVVYLKHCIKNYSGPTAYLWLETHFKEEQINQRVQLIRHMKVATSDDGTNAIYFVQEGELQSANRTYRKADVVSNDKVQFASGAIAFQLSRELYDSFKNTQEMQELQKKCSAIQRCIPIRGMEIQLRQKLLSHFQEKCKKFGSIVTVPQSGTSSLFFLTSGSLLIFTSTPQHKFAIVGFLNVSGVFNEQKMLFDQESSYGSMILSDSTIYQLNQSDLQALPDECVQTLRAGFQAKQRLYKEFLSKCESNFEEWQRKLCDRQKVNYDEILAVVLKNTNNGKIESTDKQELIEKNKKLFEKTIGSNPMKNALSGLSDKEKTLLMGTPRITSRQTNLLGLTNEQETSLFALRQLGTNIRKGVQATNSILPMAKDEVQKAKMALLQEEKTELLQRKSIAAKLGPDQPQQTIIEKLKKDKEVLIEQYPKEDAGIQLKPTTQDAASARSEKIEQEAQKPASEAASTEQSERSTAQESQQPQSNEDFQGRQAVRQNSIKSQSVRQMEIDKKRKGLMRMGI